MEIMEVTNVEELQALLERVHAAQKKFADYTQEQVDNIFRTAALAANDARIKLAKLAATETGMGVIEDKVIKNHFASEYIYNEYKDDKTCGLLEIDKSYGIKKIAEPIGVLAGIIPTTNPTSTAIFKSLISLKTRNGIIFSPHPRAKDCTIEAAKIVLEAAEKAGAPENIIGWISKPSVELTNYLMKNSNMILATGGPGMVKAAYSSGKPAIGVGAGNTPAVIDETAHIKMAVSSVLMSKTFDNGMICASEQSVIVVDEIYEQVKEEFRVRGAYILNDDERYKVGHTIIQDGKLNSAIVGQPAYKIAELAGINVPEDTKVLIGEVERTELDEPFAHEKLSPVLAMYRGLDYKDAIAKAVRLVELGGIGHTSVLYTDQVVHQDRIDYFGSQMKTGRVLINTPSSQGGIGDLYNFKLAPSLTLGCGSWGGNSVSENVGVKHLMNTKTIAERRENMLWFRVPEKVYFKYGSLPIALKELKDDNKKRAFIVTDKVLYDLGIAEKVTDTLEELDIEYKVFHDVQPDPTLANVRDGVERMESFQPDVIIAVGGGSPMDAAKIMWVMYEHPEVKFEDLALRFMDIRKRIYKFPEMGKKAMMVAVPTTSGTGSEVTPFSVVTDEKTGTKYPIADYELTPDMAVIDSEFVMSMPKSVCAYGGVDALVHAIEAYVSVLANEYTNGLALEAIRLTFKYLPASYNEGAKNVKAREKMHNAATIAGMAFANAFLGICHSMAHKVGAMFHIPHGLANAILIPHVIKFNANDTPKKQAAFSQYKYPNARFRYARISDYIGLGGTDTDDKINKLIGAVQDLSAKVGLPASFKDLGISEKDFYENLDELCEMAFDDQCTVANPSYPLLSEIKEIFIKAYNGEEV